MYSPWLQYRRQKIDRPFVIFRPRAGEGQMQFRRSLYERAACHTRTRLSLDAHMQPRYLALNRNQRNTPEELKVTMTFFLLMPWIPTAHYGEEIGMRNIEDAPIKEGSFARRNRSSCRTPMQWDTTPNAGFSTADATNIFLPVVYPDPARPTVAAQTDDPHCCSPTRAAAGPCALRPRLWGLRATGAMSVTLIIPIRWFMPANMQGRNIS